MSNQTFLYSTDKPTKPLYHECPDDGCLLMAAMSIPVFWYVVFSHRVGLDTAGPEEAFAQV